MTDAPFRDRTAEGRVLALLDGPGQVPFRLSADGSVIRLREDPETTGSVEALIDRHVPLEDRPGLREAVAAALQDGRVLDHEHRVLRSDGSLLWMRSRAVPIPDEDGAVAEWLGSAQDVTARRETDDRLREREARLLLALDIAGLGTWDWNLVTGELVWSETTYLFYGYVPGRMTPSYEAWAARVHPEDLPGVEARLRQVRDADGSFEAEFRILPGDGTVRWGRSTARVLAEPGQPPRLIGVMQDVTAAKEAEARQRLLMAELQHRVRNSLSVIRSIVRRSAQSATDLDDYVSHLEGRISALARAQAAVTRAPGTGLDLESLLRDELQAAAATEDQVALAGPPLRLPSRTAEVLGLAFHELVTNALKHGALAGPGGSIRVTWSVEAGDPPRLRLSWSERAGRLLPPAGPPGFGTELLEQMLAYNLRAEVERRRGVHGVVVDLALPLGDG